MSRVSAYALSEENQVLENIENSTNKDVGSIIKAYMGIFFDLDLFNDFLSGYDYLGVFDPFSLVTQFIKAPSKMDFYLSRGCDLRPIINKATNDGKITLKEKYKQDSEDLKRNPSLDGIVWYINMSKQLRAFAQNHSLASFEVKLMVLDFSYMKGRIYLDASIAVRPLEDKGYITFDDCEEYIKELSGLNQRVKHQFGQHYYYQVKDTPTFSNGFLHLNLVEVSIVLS